MFPPPSMVQGKTYKAKTPSLHRYETTAPCNLCSSIHYGGQEDYFSLTTTDSLSYLEKGEADDGPNGINSSGASRGNWWQGSLYY
ncbi:pentatricopeptide repeat-containing protein [Hibiscus syriacus]|uniref:Pentatricopeptide repeat-containing protein n=2 Tax=Hibiscus syriacus TaxID=106335 RepID=A0A6A2YRV3_HIBSY|nr:pentatricopeptide repeat-containing protein [Hibiscus syriacus]